MGPERSYVNLYLMNICIWSTFCALKMLQTHLNSFCSVARMWYEVKVDSFNSLCPQVSGNISKPASLLVNFCAG